MELTSTNRPFGLSIELTPRSTADILQALSLNQFSLQSFSAPDCSHVPAGLREVPSGPKQMPRHAAGNHPPSAFKFAGDHTARDHPFPSRTRKLSLAGPMVLHGEPCGRLGDRRQYSRAKRPCPAAWPFVFVSIPTRSKIRGKAKPLRCSLHLTPGPESLFANCWPMPSEPSPGSLPLSGSS